MMSARLLPTTIQEVMGMVAEDVKVQPEYRILIGLVLIGGMFAVFLPGQTWLVTVVFSVIGGLCLCEVWTSETEEGVQRWSVSDLTRRTLRIVQSLIVLVGVATIVVLHDLGDEYRQMVYLIVAGVCGADIFALAGGKLAACLPDGWRLSVWLRHHPVKLISGGKTNAGFVSGYVFGVVAIVLTGMLFDHGVVPPLWLVLTIPVAAEVGDLIASCTKRAIGTKHFTICGTRPILLEGHGGLMDRFDGHLFTAAIVAMELGVWHVISSLAAHFL